LTSSAIDFHQQPQISYSDFPQSYRTAWGQQKKRIPSLQLSMGSLTHTKPVKYKLKHRALKELLPPPLSTLASVCLSPLTLLSRCAKWTAHYFCTL